MSFLEPFKFFVSVFHSQCFDVSPKRILEPKEALFRIFGLGQVLPVRFRFEKYQIAEKFPLVGFSIKEASSSNGT